MNWIQRNFKTIIYISFLIPILLVALVSISHVTSWYGISNPYTWAIYLSVGIEIAALSALAAISAQMGRKVYVPFGIVTLIQFIGNIFFAYQYIDVNTEAFKDWVDLVDPIVSYLGVEYNDTVGHKRFLALFSGGMLPIISLSFLHMLVKFEEEDKLKNVDIESLDIDEISKLVGKKESEVYEKKYQPTLEDLELLKKELIRINEIKFGKVVKDEDNENDTNISEELTQKNDDNHIIEIKVDDENLSFVPISTEDGNTIDIDLAEENLKKDEIETTENIELKIEPDFYIEKDDNVDFYDEIPQPTTTLSEDESNIPTTKRLSYKSPR